MADTTYDNKLTEIDNYFYLTINELRTVMPKYFTNPNIDAYSTKYNLDIQNLNTSQQNLFLLKNDVEKATTDLDNNINQIDEQIQTLDKENNKLSKKLDSLIERNYGGKGMLVDTTMIYTQKKYANYLFAGIILCVAGYYKMHAKKV
jgi:predicted ribosome quality control (RQC) complex YloA/Tae2 family protein